MSTVANEMVLGIRGTYLHVKQPLLTFGLDSLLLGWACILSDSIKVGWVNIEREVTKHLKILECKLEAEGMAVRDARTAFEKRVWGLRLPVHARPIK